MSSGPEYIIIDMETSIPPKVRIAIVIITNKLGLSSAKLRAQLASPARVIHLSPSLYL